MRRNPWDKRPVDYNPFLLVILGMGFSFVLGQYITVTVSIKGQDNYGITPVFEQR